MKVFRLLYRTTGEQQRFVKADSFETALAYARRKDVRGRNAFGDVLPWGEIDRVELYHDLDTYPGYTLPAEYELEDARKDLG